MHQSGKPHNQKEVSSRVCSVVLSITKLSRTKNNPIETFLISLQLAEKNVTATVKFV
jgi:hypothetical protein